MMEGKTEAFREQREEDDESEFSDFSAEGDQGTGEAHASDDDDFDLSQVDRGISGSRVRPLFCHTTKGKKLLDASAVGTMQRHIRMRTLTTI